MAPAKQEDATSSLPSDNNSYSNALDPLPSTNWTVPNVEGNPVSDFQFARQLPNKTTPNRSQRNDDEGAIESPAPSSRMQEKNSGKNSSSSRENFEEHRSSTSSRGVGGESAGGFLSQRLPSSQDNKESLRYLTTMKLGLGSDNPGGVGGAGGGQRISRTAPSSPQASAHLAPSLTSSSTARPLHIGQANRAGSGFLNLAPSRESTPLSIVPYSHLPTSTSSTPAVAEGGVSIPQGITRHSPSTQQGNATDLNNKKRSFHDDSESRSSSARTSSTTRGRNSNSNSNPNSNSNSNSGSNSKRIESSSSNALNDAPLAKKPKTINFDVSNMVAHLQVNLDKKVRPNLSLLQFEPILASTDISHLLFFQETENFTLKARVAELMAEKESFKNETITKVRAALKRLVQHLLSQIARN